jgi:hypothetical protein
VQFPGGLYDTQIAQGKIEIDGGDGELTIRSLGRTFVMPDSEYAQYLLNLLDQIEARPEPAKLASYAIALQGTSFTARILGPGEFVRQQFALLGRQSPVGLIGVRDDPELVALFQTATFKSFNPQAWVRNQ